MLHRRRERNRDYWGTRLFGVGIVLTCSPAITVLFAGAITILMIMYAGLVMIVIGTELALSAGKE